MAMLPLVYQAAKPKPKPKLAKAPSKDFMVPNADASAQRRHSTYG